MTKKKVNRSANSWPISIVKGVYIRRSQRQHLLKVIAFTFARHTSIYIATSPFALGTTAAPQPSVAVDTPPRPERRLCAATAAKANAKLCPRSQVERNAELLLLNIEKNDHNTTAQLFSSTPTLCNHLWKDWKGVCQGPAASELTTNHAAGIKGFNRSTLTLATGYNDVWLVRYLIINTQADIFFQEVHAFGLMSRSHTSTVY